MTMFTLRLQKHLFVFLVCIGFATVSLAQPANDKCTGALELMVAADAGSCIAIEGDTRGTEDATIQTDAPVVCSGSWYRDDVWFQFSTGDDVPEYGITVQCEFTGTGDDVPSVGMAAYRSCDAAEYAFECFSTDNPTQNFISVETQCLDPNSTYYIRVWSGGDPTANAGTFRICAFETAPILPSTDVVIWSEDFENGIGEWITQGITGENDLWIWSETGTFFNAYSGVVAINSTTSSCSGAVGFPAGWYQTDMTGDPNMLPTGPPYPQYTGELISPTINCAEYSTVAIKFNTAFRGLNGNTNSELGALFSYSIDDGNTWSLPVDASSTFVQNDASNEVELRFPMPGAGGQPSVRLRFTFDGDFYYWLIDDVRLVQPEANNLRVNPFFTVPNNAIIPASQVEPIRFMADIENIGSAMQSNAKLNVTVTNDETGEDVYSEDLIYGDVMPDSTYENIPFVGTWTPDAVEASYTGVYTVLADSTDFDADDNTQTFQLEVSKNKFSKGRERTGSIRPGDANWDVGANHSWTMGCFYHIEQGDPYIVHNVSASINNPQDLTGQSVILWLYRWDNADGDNIAQEGERTRIAFNQYTFEGTESSPYLIQVPMIDFQSGDINNPVFLDAGADYLVMMEYTAPDDMTDLFLEVSEGIDYTAQIFMNTPTASEGLGVDNPRYASVLGIPQSGDFSSGIDFTMTTFTGAYRVALVNMVVDLMDGVTFLSEENKMNVFPNPTQGQLSLDLDLVDATQKASIQIFDSKGQQVLNQEYQNLQKDLLHFDIGFLPSGMYHIGLYTEQGVKIKRFVVQK